MLALEGKYTSAIIYANEIFEGVKKQTLNICNHPIFKGCRVRIMPDCHEGMGCTIGFTSELPENGEIIPNIIGVDQSCGMFVVKLKKTVTTDEFDKLGRVIKNYVPTGKRGRKIVSNLIPDELTEEIKRYNMDFLNRSSDDDLLKIGSLGSGNHFISIEKGESGTYLIIHSGSRDFGNKIAVWFQQKAIETNLYGENELKQLSYLTSSDAYEYTKCAKVCKDYSHYSRYIMSKEILDNMEWEADDSFETVHNYIGDDNIIRKGAISCKNDEKVLIPINMAYGSFIALGKGNSEWNNSGPHGAGRIFSRTKAKEVLSMQDYQQSMKDIHSCCISTGTLDEAPMAYKNGDEIKELIEPTAKIIDHLIPVYNYKAS
ncbi:MAG: RtcB family protein [Candidatus Gastranaerophilales bacterium]|nr:RtcB family protein [Candidatus Gastranaerophilales bacterium]